MFYIFFLDWCRIQVKLPRTCQYHRSSWYGHHITRENYGRGKLFNILKAEDAHDIVLFILVLIFIMLHYFMISLNVFIVFFFSYIAHRYYKYFTWFFCMCKITQMLPKLSFHLYSWLNRVLVPHSYFLIPHK